MASLYHNYPTIANPLFATPIEKLRRRLQPAAHIKLLPIRIAHGCILVVHAALGCDFIIAPFHFGNGIFDRLWHDHDQSPFLMLSLLLLESSRQSAAKAPAIGIAHFPKSLCRISLLGTDLPASACDTIIGIEKRQLAEFEIILYADKSDLRNLAAMYGTPIGPAAVMRSNERGEVNRPRRRELRACDSHALLNYPFILLRLNIFRHEFVLRHQVPGLQQCGFGFFLVWTFRQRKKLGDLFRNL